MKVESFFASDENDDRDALIIKIDGKLVFSAIDGELEDNSLMRNFNDCVGIVDLLEQAFMAGADKEEIEISQNKITWDEFTELQ